MYKYKTVKSYKNIETSIEKLSIEFKSFKQEWSKIQSPIKMAVGQHQRKNHHIGTSMKVGQFSRPPTLLIQLRSKCFCPLVIGRPVSNDPPPLPIITNQLKENLIRGLLLHVIRSFLQVGLCSQYQLIIKSGFPLTFIHLAEVNLVPIAISKNNKPLFLLLLTAKRCAGVKVELKPHYLLFCGFMFFCVQLSKNAVK